MLNRGYEDWDLGTAGEISDEETALLLSQFEGLDGDLGGLFKRIRRGLRKVVKLPFKAVAKVTQKLGPLAAFIPGLGPIAKVAGAAGGIFGGGQQQVQQQSFVLPDGTVIGASGMVGPQYLNQAIGSPMSAAQAAVQAATSGALAQVQSLNYLQAGQSPQRVSFLQSFLSPLRQTAQLVPQMISQALNQRAQMEMARVSQRAMQGMLGFQQKVSGFASGAPSTAVSQAQQQRLAQQQAQAKTAEQRRLEADFAAQSREARRRSADRKANIAALTSKQSANAAGTGIPRLSRPKLPGSPGAVPRAAATSQFAIGGVAILAVIVLLFLAFRGR